VLVAVTGWGSESDARRSREAGFDAHMTKPVALDAVQAVLARLADALQPGEQA
jgi:CheY-like chemotaxis protein